MSLPINQVVLGDCGDVMAEWPLNSVDCVVTDPPYRIGFMGKSWDRALPPRRAFRQIFRVLKPGALAFVMSSPRQDVLWRMLSMLEEIGFELRQSAIFWVYRTGFPKSYDVSKGIDRKLGLEREVLGPSKWHSEGRKARAARFDTTQTGEGDGKIETAPVSELAKKWEGWKSQTGLKPAAECILMVNKPRSEPTIVDNVLKWGTGGINVDNCRIPYKSTKDSEITAKKNAGNALINRGELFGGYGDLDPSWQSEKGRFPSNLLVSGGALDTGKITGVSGSAKLGKPHTRINEQKGFLSGGRPINNLSPNDSGDQSRFFDLDAWAEHHGFLDVVKPSRAERDFGLYGFEVFEKDFTMGSFNAPEVREKRGRKPQNTRRRNIHPTTKPVKLMAYLIELGCPPDGIVVDPFLGSGTTCIAAKKLRRKWIGIEINPEYAEIAEARINIKGPLDQYMEEN